MRNIASERVRIGYSQKDLADFLGVSRETVARYEAGTVEPRTKAIVEMANLFNCSTDYLLENTEDRLPR